MFWIFISSAYPQHVFLGRNKKKNRSFRLKMYKNLPKKQQQKTLSCAMDYRDPSSQTISQFPFQLPQAHVPWPAQQHHVVRMLIPVFVIYS